METKLDLQEASHRSTISQDRVVDALSVAPLAPVGPEATYPCQKSQWSPSERPGTQGVEGPHHSACHHLQVWLSMPLLCSDCRTLAVWLQASGLTPHRSEPVYYSS